MTVRRPKSKAEPGANWDFACWGRSAAVGSLAALLCLVAGILLAGTQSSAVQNIL
jgi:hypothetical protein